MTTPIVIHGIAWHPGDVTTLPNGWMVHCASAGAAASVIADRHPGGIAGHDAAGWYVYVAR